MEASPAKAIQYFNGEKQNLIPLFQRPYSWTKPNWDTLWNDVLTQYDLEDAHSHFMGAIVSVPARSVPVGVSKHLIIDGQQRLTTICLLLCALRDTVDGNNASRIQEVYLLNRFRDPEDTLKFVPTQIDRQDYSELVLEKKVPANPSLIKDAYLFFKEKLTVGLDLNVDKISSERVLTIVENSLQVVMINIGEGDDPYLIFESLNFKGQELTQADLVRNYILMKFKHSVSAGGEQQRIHSQYWHPLEKRLEGAMPEFLRHFIMREGENIKQGGIYVAVRNSLKGIEKPDLVESEIIKISLFGSLYGQILDPNSVKGDEDLSKGLQDIKDLNVTTSYPLILRLLELREQGKLSNEALSTCLKLIASFVVRRSICGVPTNALNKLFLGWCKSFPTTADEVWLRQAMSASSSVSGRFPSDAEVIEALLTQPQYVRGNTRFVLTQIEKSYAHKEQADLSTATIEHIMPQTLNLDWKEELGDSFEATHNRLKDNIGNLTLSGYNTELGNASFAFKKEKLGNSHIELNRWIREQVEWGEEEITTRAGMLAKVAIAIWPGPSSKS